MKKVPLKYLKEHLAEVAEEVSKGSAIQITKYERPYFRLLPNDPLPEHEGTWVGDRVGRPLRRGLKVNMGMNKILGILAEDREDPF